MILSIYIFWYYFKSHRQYPNTSTSHCYGKDDESNILPFFSVDVKPHDLPKIFSPGKPPIAAAPREKMKVPLHCSESDTDPHLTAKNWLISHGVVDFHGVVVVGNRKKLVYNFS